MLGYSKRLAVVLFMFVGAFDMPVEGFEVEQLNRFWLGAPGMPIPGASV